MDTVDASERGISVLRTPLVIMFAQIFAKPPTNVQKKLLHKSQNMQDKKVAKLSN